MNTFKLVITMPFRAVIALVIVLGFGILLMGIAIAKPSDDLGIKHMLRDMYNWVFKGIVFWDDYY